MGSSFPLTFIFFKMVKNHQPDIMVSPSESAFFQPHPGVYMVWFTLIFFFFLASLFRMIGKTDPTWAVVRWGIVDQEWYDQTINPVVEKLKTFALVAKSE